MCTVHYWQKARVDFSATGNKVDVLSNNLLYKPAGKAIISPPCKHAIAPNMYLHSRNNSCSIYETSRPL